MSALMGMIFLTVLFTYAMTTLMDWCCPSVSTALAALHNNEQRVIIGGRVARDAGLTGLRKDERKIVLEHLLHSKVY